MKKIMTFLLSATLSSSAFAWGDREQGALIGFAAGALLHHYAQPRHPDYGVRAQQGYVAPQRPVYAQPQYAAPRPPVHLEQDYRHAYRQQPVYGTRHVYDAYCRCYRETLVQIGWE